MEGLFTSKSFREFYNKMSAETQTVAEYFEIMKDAMPIIAEEAGLGYCQIVVNSPATSLELEGIQDRSVIYQSSQGYNQETGIRQTYVTDDWGIIQIEIYPLPGFEWAESQYDEIKFLIQVVYDCCCKARVYILMKQALITDSLTGAANSTGIINYTNDLKKADRLEKYDAIYFNIKNFNYINQRVGNRQGDKVLVELSRMIRDFLEKGELFGRVGGDTFFLLVEKERTDECVKFITSRRVLVDLEQKSMEFDLMIRAGIYRIKPYDSANRVLEAAKAAYQYTRNPSAGSIVYFNEDMLKESSHDAAVANDFVKALNKEEFVVYYQPKVDLETGTLESAEALCRWIKDDEIVPPMEFIPILEREGTICHLDFYMLTKVCAHIKDWEERGIEPVKISVNFSRAHILNRKLADKIIKILKNNKVESKFIEIEITEMSGYEDFEALSEFVDAMKEYGISTSLDDFGTGYSSLNLLKDLNVDTVKLDKSFLEKITSENSQDKSMVKNIVSMVNEMNMRVVAEGVENDVQRSFLREVNCSYAQGFLFDKPMPKEKFEFRLMGERMY